MHNRCSRRRRVSLCADYPASEIANHSSARGAEAIDADRREIDDRTQLRGLSEFACANGEHGITSLVYGTREPGDNVYYPTLGQVLLRGLGVTIPATQD